MVLVILVVLFHRSDILRVTRIALDNLSLFLVCVFISKTLLILWVTVTKKRLPGFDIKRLILGQKRKSEIGLKYHYTL